MNKNIEEAVQPNRGLNIDAFLVESAEEQLRRLGPITLWIGTLILIVVNIKRFTEGDWIGIVISIVALGTGWFVVKANAISAHTRIALFISICFLAGIANLFTQGLIDNGRIALFYACVGSVSINRWRVSLSILVVCCLSIFVTGLGIQSGILQQLPAIQHPPLSFSEVVSYTLYFGIFAGVTQFSIYMIYKRLIIAWEEQQVVQSELREQNRLVKTLVTKRDEELIELKRSQNELARYKNQLEDMVNQRTIELNVERDRANEANQAKSLFVARMSHELRTPLNAILGYSQLLIEELLDEGVGPDEFQADIERIETSGRHLLDLINNVLDLSKIESDKIEVFLEEHSLSKLVAEIEIHTRPLSVVNQNEFLIMNQASDAIIETDRQRFKQILINLLGNAFKFTQDGCVTLHIQTCPYDPLWLQFDVTDTGKGIDEAFLNQLFEPFVQENDSLTRPQDGTGLGLAISKSLAQLIGGDILVQSQVGKGTKFTLLLPIKASESTLIPQEIYV